MAEVFDVTNDTELKTRVRSQTQYDDNDDELPDADLDELINASKHRVFLETGSKDWYDDSGLGMVLVAYTCMRCKSAVENISLAKYSLGDESVEMKDVDPEDSQQIQGWAEDVRIGLNASSLDESPRQTIGNTSGYIGETYIRGSEEFDSTLP